ncbi:DUF4276 family protein [Pseudomonas sp. KNUC1026]|uniref:DUF4276 family protein n=1 Tax=Pseudomonas sp. KNUC1026 TaxID=2893890 RepID=UPI001F28CD70|nr:DUF4276 family protein [Pseudomonas sp. KNUC1026]UFH48851.1 DUF4276 family protein [Pseudomonas sp. KNUC1026]
MPGALYIVGEDGLCCALAKALVRQCTTSWHTGYEQNTSGFGEFVKYVAKMNQVASTTLPVLMLADGDQAPCPVEQIKAWLPPKPAARLMLRLAVRESESWVLADRQGLAAFLDISMAHIPAAPDELRAPKESLLTLIRKSKKRLLREEMLPAKQSRAPVGLGYVLHLESFLAEGWSLKRAAENSPSLARAAGRVSQVLGAEG